MNNRTENNRLKKIFRNKWFELSVRWMVGLIFVYASYHKIIEPARFAKVIYGYDLFPSASINLLAIFLPYLEFYSGLALILGIWNRGAIFIINGMLFAFIIALTINLVRGHQFDCGCFSFGEKGGISSTVQLLVRDVMLFMTGVYILFFNKVVMRGHGFVHMVRSVVSHKA